MQQKQIFLHYSVSPSLITCHLLSLFMKQLDQQVISLAQMVEIPESLGGSILAIAP